MKRVAVPCPSCAAPVGWHVLGAQPGLEGVLYCGTLLPIGVDLVSRSADGAMQFGRPDKFRRLRSDGADKDARHVRSRAQVEPPTYPFDWINEMTAACRIAVRFRSVRARAPFRTWCQSCGRNVEVAPPPGADNLELASMSNWHQ